MVICALGPSNVKAISWDYQDVDRFVAWEWRGNPQAWHYDQGVLLKDAATSMGGVFDFVNPETLFSPTTHSPQEFLDDNSITIGSPYNVTSETLNSKLGFKVGDEWATVGEVWFYIRDDGDNPAETVKVTIDDLEFRSGGFSKSFVAFNGAATGTILGDVNADGKVNYTIERVAGDFYVDYAVMSIHVPDGGVTLTLLGTGMVVLFGLKRRFSL